MSDFANDKAVRDALRKEFPASELGKKPQPYKKDSQKGKCGECGGFHGLPAIHLDVVNHATVTNRLNDAVPDWHYTVDAEYPGSGKGFGVRGTMTVGGISRIEYGDGKDPKEAVSDFIKRGAMRFGVAIDLWAKQELAGYGDSGPVEDSSPPAVLGAGGVKQAPPANVGAGMVPGEIPGQAASWPDETPAPALPADGAPAPVHQGETGSGTIAPAGAAPLDGPGTAAPKGLGEATEGVVVTWADLKAAAGGKASVAREALVSTSGVRYTAATAPKASAQHLAAAFLKLTGGEPMRQEALA